MQQQAWVIVVVIVVVVDIVVVVVHGTAPTPGFKVIIIQKAKH